MSAFVADSLNLFEVRTRSGLIVRFEYSGVPSSGFNPEQLRSMADSFMYGVTNTLGLSPALESLAHCSNFINGMRLVRISAIGQTINDCSYGLQLTLG